MSRTLPIQLNIAGKICVVVGGGNVAARKVMALREANAVVRVVSPTVSEELKTLAQIGQIEWIESLFHPEHLENASLVFAATDNAGVNEAISLEARQRNLLVNRADRPDAGDFITPAVLRRDSLLVTVSTEGGSPALTAHLVRELEQDFVDNWAKIVELFADLRDYIKENYPLSERAALNRSLVGKVSYLREILDTQGREAALVYGKNLMQQNVETEESEA